MKLLGGIIEISSISNTKYPGDTTGDSMVATLKGSAEKGETAQVYGMPGFVGKPPKGSKGVRFRIGSVDIIIGTLNYVVPLPSDYGETKVYSTDEDGNQTSKIELLQDGSINIEPTDESKKLNMVFGDTTIEFSATGMKVTNLSGSYDFLTHFHLGNLGVNTGQTLPAGGGVSPPVSAPSTDSSGDVISGTGTSLDGHTHGPGTFAAGGDPVTGASGAPV